ncbi:MAG: N,N'-diacetylchitobiose phosphorylase [Kiritimatiellaceae bacterium]|nr:N,N'-diacetylchitobiose phosphorylase [Kiritimatiellaceae bacterium]
MRYGIFDDANREYVIQRPDTPTPWSNYIGSASFGGLVTNNAAGYTFYRSAAQGRLTRFRFNESPSGLPGRFIYLLDRKSGDFWTNSWMPVAKPLDQFSVECRHGSGYTAIKSVYSGIESEAVYFVPKDALHEVWKITITNRGRTTRSIRAIPFIEPQCNWNAIDDSTNLQYTQYIACTEYKDGIIDLGSNINMPVDPDNFQNKDQKRHTFFALTGASPSGFDSDLKKFLGTYGRYDAPQALLNGGCSDSTATGDMPCAALQTDLELAPGQSCTFAVVFGVGRTAEAQTAIQSFDNAAKLDAALAAVKAHWHSRLNRLHTETPDGHFNSMVNMWAPFNNLMTFYWARTASMVYAGERDGLGYRDAVQDIVGASSIVLEEAGERLKLLITGQYANGGAMPVVKPFAHNPGHEELPSHYRSDDCMWLFNAIPAYVKESGDFGFYRQALPFADQGEATVFGHLRRAIEFNIERSGAHGLPCGLAADWNDCLRLGEKGETVFVAFQLRYALREYIDIANRLGESSEAAWAQAQLKTLDAALEKYTWDGEWYLRAYRFDGMKFGSKENDEGSIFMNPQVWAVLSGHATGKKAMQAMDSMHSRLSTDHGIMLCTPPYVHTDPKVCLARLMNPGMKENGGIFNHTQGWAVLAAAELGLGDRAWEYMRNVMPASFNERAEVREVEPYVVCQSTHSRFSPRFGAGRVSWLSGSAVWNYVAMTTAILGIQPDYEGLRINPCVPKDWKKFSATRQFRDAEYRITVENPNGVCKGVKNMTVDGKAVEGNLVPLAKAGSTVTVHVTLG